jgi:SAM-dependent methyltransferase
MFQPVTKTLSFGDHSIVLEQTSSDIHFPSTVGLNFANTLYTLYLNSQNETSLDHLIPANQLNFNSVLDVGCGIGHLSLLAASLFPNISKVFAMDLLEDSVAHLKNNWGVYQSKSGSTQELITQTGDLNEIFDKVDDTNRMDCDLVLCNPANVDASCGIEDPFFVTEQNGRYMLDSMLKHCANKDAILKSGGYIFTTDTSLIGFNETNQLLIDLYGSENSNWWVVDSIEMDVPFLNLVNANSSFEVNPEWKKSMLESKRLLVRETNGNYYQSRRYLLIKKG